MMFFRKKTEEELKDELILLRAKKQAAQQRLDEKQEYLRLQAQIQKEKESIEKLKSQANPSLLQKMRQLTPIANARANIAKLRNSKDFGKKVQAFNHLMFTGEVKKT